MSEGTVTLRWDRGWGERGRTEWYGVPVPRVPVKGDQITGPGSLGWGYVASVDFDYSAGLASPPHITVTVTEPIPWSLEKLEAWERGE